MIKFRQFLTEMNRPSLPDIMHWVRSFFENRMNPNTLMVYADQLEELGLPSSVFFREVASSWTQAGKKGRWNGKLVSLFYNLFGSYPGEFNLELNDLLKGTWLITNRSGQMKRHIVHPSQTSYRLALANGTWFTYTNTGDERVSVVSSKHSPTEESERWYPAGRINIKDYKPIHVNSVPDEVLYFAFWKILESQVRGNW